MKYLNATKEFKLTSLITFLCVVFIFLLCRNYFAELLFESFTFKEESVLVPNKIGNLGVNLKSSTAVVKHLNHEIVIRVICKGETAAVLHEFFEFWRLV